MTKVPRATSAEQESVRALRRAYDLPPQRLLGVIEQEMESGEPVAVSVRVVEEYYPSLMEGVVRLLGSYAVTTDTPAQGDEAMLILWPRPSYEGDPISTFTLPETETE